MGSRLLRLGVPLLFFLLVVNRLADFLGNQWDEDDTFLGYLAVTEFSVMWFVVALLACSLGYAALRCGRSRHSWTPISSTRAVWAGATFATLYGVVSAALALVAVPVCSRSGMPSPGCPGSGAWCEGTGGLGLDGCMPSHRAM